MIYEIETMTTSKVRNNWSRVIKQVFTKNTLVVLEKSGLTVGAVIGPDDLRVLQAHRDKITLRKNLLEQAWKQFEHVPVEELAREIEQARHEVCEERNTQQQP